MSNMFSEAVESTHTPGKMIEPKVHFFHEAHEQDKRRAMAANMTRQQQFDNGLIGVEDLDDEELRMGQCRNNTGAIPKPVGKTTMVRRDLYDEMVAEHEKRTDEKLRQQLDVMLETMIDIATDDTVEPADRFKAAQYLFERVKGKTPDKVHVSVVKAPWEEMLGGVAKISREESLRRRGVIDAEVVAEERDTEPQAEPEDDSGEARTPSAPEPQGEPEAPVPDSGAGWSGLGPEQRTTVPSLADMGYMNAGDLTDYRITQPIPTPTHDNPETTSATANPVSTSEQIRVAAERAIALAEKRKDAKSRIQGAKKRRIIKRTMGLDAGNVDLSSVQDKFTAAQEGET